MTLQQYLDYLGWDMAELQRQAGINYRTVRKAVDGEPISARRARDIAKALSVALGRQVNVGDIDHLNVV